MNNIVEGILWVWQILQNLIGLGYKLVLGKSISKVEKSKTYNIYYKQSSGGVTLGKYIFVSNRFSQNSILHETGHVKQSRLLGPLYLFVIGIPSIIHAAICNKPNYFHFYTEKWANNLVGLTADSLGRLIRKKS